ncbi:MAG: hypothetical protein RLZZ301_185 [Bacteroidota bacterium]|jgi:LEA14-like dessication related protein
MKIAALISLLFLLGACKALEEPIEMNSYDGSEIEQFSAQLVKFKAAFNVHNNLLLPLKMKPGKFEVFLDQQKIGDLYIDAPIKLKAHKDSKLNIPMHLDPEPGFFVTAYQATKKAKLTVKISGYPKVGALFVYKTVLYSKEVQLDPSLFVPYIPKF